SLIAADHGARDLHLVVSTKAQAHALVLGGRRHRAAPDVDAIAIELDPARQQRRVFSMLEGCLEVSRLIERRRGAHEQVRRQCGGGDAEAFGALARPDADAARNTEYGVKAPGLRDG